MEATCKRCQEDYTVLEGGEPSDYCDACAQELASIARQEHLKYCKERALVLVAEGDLRQAFASMCSDIMKSEHTSDHKETNQLGFQLLISGHLDTADEMTKWINGYQ